MSDISALYTISRYPLYQVLTAMGYAIPSPEKLTTREINVADCELASTLIKHFTNVDTNFSRNVLRLMCSKMGKIPELKFDYIAFDTNPFEYFVWLIRQFRELGHIEGNDVVEAMQSKHDDIDWQLILSGQAYYCYEIRKLVSLATKDMWRFQTNYGLVGTLPLSEIKYGDLTGFEDPIEVQKHVDQYRRAKLSSKMYYSLDTGKIVNSTIWPGMVCHDALLSLASNNIKRYTFFVAYLKFSPIPSASAASSIPVVAPVVAQSITGSPVVPTPATPSPKDKTRKKIPSAIRFQIWERDCGNKTTGRCFCCHSEISIQAFEAGHIQSAAEGGPDSIENLVVICGPCNRSMGKTNMKVYCQRYYPDKVYNWP